MSTGVRKALWFCDQSGSCGGSRYYGTDETGTDPREGEFRRGSGTGSEEIRGRIR